MVDICDTIQNWRQPKKRAYYTPTAGGAQSTSHLVFHFAKREKIFFEIADSSN
jgi:hypothetical protein